MKNTDKFCPIIEKFGKFDKFMTNVEIEMGQFWTRLVSVIIKGCLIIFNERSIIHTLAGEIAAKVGARIIGISSELIRCLAVPCLILYQLICKSHDNRLTNRHHAKLYFSS